MSTRLQLRLYRWLVRVLPASLRTRHGAAMESAFEEMLERSARAGRGAVMMLWLREAADVLRTSATLRRGTGSANAGVRLPRTRTIGALLDDVRIAYRATLRHRAFFLLATITLGLGIGAATATYSALKAVVLEPVPFPQPERLVVPWLTMGSGDALLSLERTQVEGLRAATSVFERVEEFGNGALTLTGDGEPARVQVMKITPGLPALLGMEPTMGRTFTADELAGGGARVLLLSHAFWLRHFGGRTDVLGGTLRADGETWTIVGVMPPHARQPDGDPESVDLWLPLPDAAWDRLPLAQLASGLSIEMARDIVTDLMGDDGPNETGLALVPVLKPGPLHEHLRVIAVAVALLLLVASVNVSNLLLQRTHVRRTEIAVRVALGAGRSRIMRQIVLESLILSVAGAACGVLLAWLGVRAVVALRPAELEMLRTLRMDGGVIVFAITVSAMVGLFFGLLPALRSTRTEATAALSGGARAGTADAGRVRWVLVAAEVALSFALLVSAGLVALSLHRLATRDPGYAAKELISIDVRLPAWRYAEEAARAVTFDGIVSNIRRIPTVRSVSLAGGVPPRMAGRFGRLSINGGTRATTPYPFDGTEVDTAFFATIGEPIIAGRAFTRGDATSALNPVIVAESAARALFPGLNPLGQRFSLEGDAPYTVIGVARDIHPTGLAEAADEPLAYWPLQRVRARMTVVVRADAITAQLLQDLRQIVRHAEPDAVVDIATVEELLRTSLARERFTTSLLSGFAALALLLAAIGLYGVLSQVVLSRTREIGVRVAMGASAARIAALVLRAGMSAVVIGLVFGGMLAAVLVKLLRAQVFGITAMPSVAYGGATVAVLVVAAAAIAVPALHAARLDPVRAIRVE